MLTNVEMLSGLDPAGPDDYTPGEGTEALEVATPNSSEAEPEVVAA